MNRSQPTLLNESEIVALKGIYKVVQVNHGIGLVGESFELWQEARKLLKIEWTKDSKAQDYQRVPAFDQYHQPANASSAGEVIQNDGNAHKILQSVTKTYES